ncbi:hypothetical protein J2TS6_26780 [Paenibacillus albilobatus]|uniref:DNA-binding response regulator n=2 Tax=Paenibacillus TaxID=44249 RepID=A0A919XIU9_9BACL|nr:MULTISPECIES: response regulator transcription factor [Paenibacillus]GIO31537.1 hypothetical protein J2TS6_26780 [Paenibacillus albilobatus]
MMLKVLIVDDEPKLREGLRTLIPWEEQGYRVVDTAANGQEALEKYEAHKPELILADIRMPGMDGLQLIQELRSRGADSHMLILSGYADFEYAKRAISCRVDGYLLKPVDEDELVSYLEQIREAIEKERQFNQWSREEPARSKDAVLKELLLPESGSLDGGRLASLAASLGIPEGPCEVVLLRLWQLQAADEEALSRIRQALDEGFRQQALGICFHFPPYLGLLLTTPPECREGDRELYRMIAEFMSAGGAEGLAFSAAAGGTVSGPEEAHISLAAASDGLKRSFFCPQDTFIRNRSAEVWQEEEGDPVLEPDEAEHRLLLVLETGNSAKLQPLVEAICRRMAAEGMDEMKLKENLIRLAGGVLARLESSRPDMRAFWTEHGVPVGAFYASSHISELTGSAVAYFMKISERLRGESRGSEIERMSELIERRYNENLKLETLADLFNYNSAYLGKMFKNTTGEYFNTYLDKVRIEKAKAFLDQGMKVYEVAEKVGYMNPDYFNMKFRKYVGVSPTSYRKGK